MCDEVCDHRTMSDSELIGATEAARILRVDRSTVSRRVKTGALTPAQQLPSGLLLFDRDEIEQAAALDPAVSPR